MAVAGTVDIFGRSVETGAPLSADAARLLIDADGDFGTNEDLIIQTFENQYQQAINRLYDLSSPRIYLFAGRPSGQMQIGKIVGSRGLSSAFIEKYGDVCNIPNIIKVVLGTGCGSTPGGVDAITTRSNVIQSLSYRMEASQGVVNEGVNLIYVSMDSAAGSAA